MEQALWVDYKVGGSTFQIKGLCSKGPFVLEPVMWSWCQGVVFFETVVSTARCCILDGALVSSKEHVQGNSLVGSHNPAAQQPWDCALARLHLAPGQS